MIATNQPMPKRPRSPMFSAASSAHKKQLLFIRRTDSFGGAERVIVDLLGGIDYEKNSVCVASLHDVFSNLTSDLGLRVTWVPLSGPFKGSFFGKLFRWIRYFWRLRPDKIVVAEGWFRDFPLAIVFAAWIVARGDVWMMQLHPADEPSKRTPGLRWTRLSRPDIAERLRSWLPRGILAVSRGVKDRLVKGYGYPADKITVIYNGVDTNRFSPVPPDIRGALRQRLQIPENATVIVSSARLDRFKRLDRLIQAFAALSVDRKDLWLLMTGEGPSRPELQSQAQSTSNPERIRFLGQVEDVCPILQASDVFVLPSDEEGFGIALVEAMACELVCVATRTVGPSEIIEDRRNGFLTDRSSEGVTEGLRSALTLGRNERKAIGSSAREKITANFRVELAVSKGLSLLQIHSRIPKNTDPLILAQDELGHLQGSSLVG